MLDANARCIPKGIKFFVTGYVKKGTLLDKLGVVSRQPYLCKMLDNSTKYPRFSIKVDNKVHVIKFEYDYTFLIYQGKPNGADFMNSRSKAECEKVIGKFNNTYWKTMKK